VATGFTANTHQIRTHAGHIDEVRARFDAVKAASANIAQDDAAYGLLCGWIAGILEGRHRRQDELLAYVQENLALSIEALNNTAQAYGQADETAEGHVLRAGRM
jgi:hypothetical protein